MTQTTVKTRRKFDATFKREAVNNWLARRKSAEVIAQELGISANRLYAWKQRFAPADAGGERGGGGQAWHAGRAPGPVKCRPARGAASARTARHIKKNLGHFVRTITERYEWIHTMKAEHSILALCQNLAVSASGYYDWQRRRTAPGPRAVANQTLTTAIQAIHARSRQTYGSPGLPADTHAPARFAWTTMPRATPWLWARYDLGLLAGTGSSQVKCP